MAIQAEQDPTVSLDTYGTYQWSPIQRDPGDVRVTAALRAQIRDDINRHLADKGYLRVNTDADFSVNHQVTIEGESERLIWRGTATAEVRQRTSPADRSDRVAEAVRTVLARFPSR